MPNYEKIDKKVLDFVNEIEKDLTNYFYNINKIEEYNFIKVLESFKKNKIEESHFQESTGYGYTDIGRDKIEEVYKDVFHTEDALVRQQIVSGTHAISLALFSITSFGDEILSITGLPYDTLLSTIGINNEEGSLKEFGVKFNNIDLNDDGSFNIDLIKNSINVKTKVIYIQRSRGYSMRPALSVLDIKKVIDEVKSINNKLIIIVDNCYGEFTDTIEPTDVGADIMCGSLIKNPGGGIVKSGGYIVGKKDLIRKCSIRLTAPGIEKEVGVSFNQNRNVLEGLFLAPQIVSNVIKGSKLFIDAFTKLGFNVSPKSNEKQNDIVVAIELKNKELLNEFCNIIQNVSPIDSFVKPYASHMPGYDSNIIMACGSFISGSSIELSCDGPEKEPYIVYFQGGLSYYHIKYALLNILDGLELL